ncbi:unnamed protein product [Leptosia nina]|uniref:Uncharacterized protein n=1 Tax=Leptosia nina TaxID=320188 RepID=A0AAV1J8C5_9NEOP
MRRGTRRGRARDRARRPGRGRADRIYDNYSIATTKVKRSGRGATGRRGGRAVVERGREARRARLNWLTLDLSRINKVCVEVRAALAPRAAVLAVGPRRAPQPQRRQRQRRRHRAAGSAHGTEHQYGAIRGRRRRREHATSTKCLHFHTE